MILFITSILLIATLGYLAQSTGLCLVRGVDETLSGKPFFLLSILLSGSFAWVSILIGQYAGVEIPFISYQYSIFALAGGGIFGMGAAFNTGCGVSTISKLARGQVVMLFTVMGWLVGWLLLTTFIPQYQITKYQLDSDWHFSILVSVSLIILVCVTRMNVDNRRLWLSMLGVGLTAGIVFLTEPKWTPSGLLNDISLAVWYRDSSLWPSGNRFILIASLITGMAVAAVHKKTFKFIPLQRKGWLRHLLAGCLMGIGAAIAGGGNDSQLLLGLPSLSPAGITTVVMMLIGIIMGRAVSKKL
ncbi:YeeE/YedE thiosulfate transporter family protein [Shewanella colwelliana]|uniref:YeeE/YedE thiosulfate transporter family protein n=1 Tax=Shewanella colwelliana TaxID=23 RepID=UPI00299EC0B8|nr:YeeE/YedE thiosulfate transporter family protein [Shewanella colwelliana]MDX1282967.1 YeeE/YedE thiosulfate transporter family protein [Shewanella colwelliana]